MDLPPSTLALYAVGAAALGIALVKARSRLTLSRAKHRSLTGHARMSRRVAALLAFYGYDDRAFFRSDDPPEAIALQREAAFMRLGEHLRTSAPKTLALGESLAGSVSDMQFTEAYRVPFQYRDLVGRHLRTGAFVERSDGVTVTDLDGNRFTDLTGSYGVNVFGYDFYKACMAKGLERAAALGPVLGPYHPVVADNVARLKAISGLDEVSFHMSGTEAVMQAVRLARYHTRRTHLVRFCGAYHGWWGDVQPGVGNPLPAHETYTLADMSERTLEVLRSRKNIACVLVNPLQALHPNAGAPGDSTLVDGSRRSRFDRDAYAQWLCQLRAVCSERGIVLIFDEVFLGFRLARGGAQSYFGVKADLVTYGKTLGGGFPIGAVCGRKGLMRRFRDDRPADVCFARGTFNSHPAVMAAMNEFLIRLDTPEIAALYDDLDDTWNARAMGLNARLQALGLPVQVANLSSVWTVLYTQPGRYHWMFQYYLRAEGLALSWVGTGRLIFSLNFTPAEFEAVADRFVAAAQRMARDGWWWTPAGRHPAWIKRRVLREMLTHRFGLADNSLAG